MKNIKLTAIITLAIITLSGCATKAPTKADFMRMHALDEKKMSIDQKGMAKEWDRGSDLKKSGEDLAIEGEKLIKSGDHDMTLGKQKIEQGNRDFTEGNAIMKENERIFKEKYPDLKLNLTK
jgi:hypothetical protein